jgi:hypothetical protein
MQAGIVLMGIAFKRAKLLICLNYLQLFTVVLAAFGFLPDWAGGRSGSLLYSTNLISQIAVT